MKRSLELLEMRHARNLTDFWLLTPDWLFWWVMKKLGHAPEVIHEMLCDAFGCRCTAD